MNEWKREWGLASFDAYYAGDLATVSVSLYKCKAEIDSIQSMLDAKRCQVSGLSAFAGSYDDVLHGAFRRWRGRLIALRSVSARHAAAIATGTATLPLCTAMRTWRRLLVGKGCSPTKAAMARPIDGSEVRGLHMPD